MIFKTIIRLLPSIALAFFAVLYSPAYAEESTAEKASTLLQEMYAEESTTKKVSTPILPLLQAIRAGDTNSVRYHLQQKDAGTTVPTDYDSGITPLHNAIASNQPEEVKRLLAEGADVNARTKRTLTPLSFALDQSNFTIVEILINHGADINTAYEEEYEEKPLLAAALTGNVDIIQLLLDNGADVSVKDFFGKMPLSNTLIGDHADAARLLIQNGADVFYIGSIGAITGETMLHSAALLRSVNVAQVLLENGVDVNAATWLHGTPLDTAYEMPNNSAMIDLLKKHGGEKATTWSQIMLFVKTFMSLDEMRK